MNEKLNNALNEISDKHLSEAQTFKRNRRPVWIGAVAALLTVVMIWWTVANPVVTAKAVSKADYDALQSYSSDEKRAARDQLADFFVSSMSQILSESNGENQVFSPMNLYMALAVTAELSGGEPQILELLGVDSLEQLRTQANCLWNATYREGHNECLLANSLWLDNDLSYNQSTMDTLAKNYYTSVYRGNFGSAMTDHAISAWLNGQTGGLLKDSADNIHLDADTVFALYSTVFYQAKWSYEFSASDNTRGVFHGANGDLTCTYMNKERMQGYYYWGDSFGAVTVSLKDGSQMWLILPDAGKTVDDVLSDPDFGYTIFHRGTSDSFENAKYMKINLSLPKFDIRASGDLKEDLQAMGVTDVFDRYAANFSAITGQQDVWLTAVNQATRVCVDEKGITAASYIEIPGAGSAAPPEEIIDFVLDRPFIFVVTNHWGLPLFAGVVNIP